MAVQAPRAQTQDVCDHKEVSENDGSVVERWELRRC